MRNFSAPWSECNTTYKAFHKSGYRDFRDVRHIVIHATEDLSGAAAIAEYFSHPVSGGSTNLVVDDRCCYRTMYDLEVPWGAPPLNHSGFHIEHVAYSAWPRCRWMLHQPMLHRSAYKAASRCKKFNIPVVWLDVEAVRKRLPGVTSHRNVSYAFHETDHTDPGLGFPYKYWMGLVKLYRKAMR